MDDGMMAKRRLTSGKIFQLLLEVSDFVLCAIQFNPLLCGNQEWILFLFLLAILHSLHSVDR